MNKVIIYATEGIYQGLHGIYNIDICEVDSYDEAVDIALDLASSLIEHYDLEEEYEETMIESEFNWEIHKILPEYAETSINDLAKILYSKGYKDFVNTYCYAEEF